VALGNPADAEAHAAEGLTRATQLDSRRIACLAHLAMAHVRSSRNDPGAVDSLVAALEAAETADTPYERSIVLDALSRQLEHVDTRAQEAAAMAAEALAIRQELRITTDSLPRVCVS
jgi:hypothetical protein